MSMLSVKDSRGRESTTLSFVGASWFAATVMFMWKGGAAALGSYGAAVGLILAIWLGREWTEKTSKPAAGTKIVDTNVQTSETSLTRQGTPP